MNIFQFEGMKREGRKISMVTCYDTWSARIIDKSSVEMILVGDSLSMVMHGHPTTLSASTELMALHTAAVARGAPSKFIVGDMPFPSFRMGIPAAMQCVDALMKSGAHSVKLEAVHGHEDVVAHIVGSGVPVMGHLGLTPQSHFMLGGFRVQGKTQSEAERIMADALKLQELGCFALVLECVPPALAREITQRLRIPTIGIGAGPDTDGQVLVLQDMLGMNPDFKPKFLKKYIKGFELIQSALNEYDHEVKSGIFPAPEHAYKTPEVTH